MLNIIKKVQANRKRRAFINRKLAQLQDVTLFERINNGK